MAQTNNKPSLWQGFKGWVSKTWDSLTQPITPTAVAATKGVTDGGVESDRSAAAVAGANRAGVQEAGATGVAGAQFVMENGLAVGIGALGSRAGALAAGQAVYPTTKAATKAAEELGYRKIKETIHGEAIYTNGKRFITRDTTGHNGGAWKMADSIRALGSRETRLGTFDALLKRIGD